MDRKIIVTSDGSNSIAVPGMGVTYHSTHGAIQESMHVFIEKGLRYYKAVHPWSKSMNIFEMGFGTGLNALLTMMEAASTGHQIYYETVEAYPLEISIVQSLNYCEQLNRADITGLFMQMHEAGWNTAIELTPHFRFKKIHCKLADYIPSRHFNIIYFDAFAPDIQPELWRTEVFKKLNDTMEAGGVLTTYCSKSIVRKAMAEAGLQVEKVPGPPHKREIVRAVK